MVWVESELDLNSVNRLARELAVSNVTAALLCARGYNKTEDARAFLDPRLQTLDDPFALTHMDLAVKRIRVAMEKGEKILVYGDYDVDGVTSTVLLISILQRYGINPRYFVPLRLEEGYGLSLDAIERALTEEHPDLLIAVDCGTSSREPVAHLRQHGIDVIILDHHTPKEAEALPEDCIIVNPHAWDAARPESAAWKNLSAVGIVFKFLHALLKDLRAEGDDLANEIRLKDYLDLVALGTICDLVPLLGENRTLVYHGLRLLKKTPRVGLSSLITTGGLELGENITPFDVSFRIGPRINASGRLADATIPIQLLLSEDWKDANSTAQQLDSQNRDRQEIERAITEKAIALVEANYSEDLGLVLYQPDWHPGVVGIVASRLTHQFHRPTLVLGAEGSLAKGSGRSISGVSLVDILQPCASLIDKWGGHPMAVGLSLPSDRVDALRVAFNASLKTQFNGSLPPKTLTIDRWIEPHELNRKLLEELEQLEPFGQGNPEPVFAIREVELCQLQSFGRGHLRCNIQPPAGPPITAIAWNKAQDNIPPNTLLSLAFRFHWNTWRGQKSPRLTIIDWRPIR